MMPKPAALRALLVAALVACASGCAAYRPLQIEPVARKGYVVAPKFTQAYYYRDRDNTLYYILRSRTTDPATHQPVDQIFTVRVFWRPVGGKTTLDPTALNATYRYVLMTPNSIGMYEGAGFVRLFGKTGRRRLPARLMDGDLRLTQSSTNFQDTLGRSRIRGNINATFDDVRANNLLHEAQREFFARSLAIGAATRPAGNGPTTTSRPAFDNPFLLPAPGSSTAPAPASP
jgi:hypothetical protein